MSEWTNNTLSRKPGFTLAEAATTSGWSVNELLNFGALGEIKIYINVSNDYVVFDIDHNTCEFEDAQSGSRKKEKLVEALDGNGPKVCPDLWNLFLSENDCKEIAIQDDTPYSQGCSFAR